MKKNIIIALLFVPLLMMAQKPWTLQQCVDTALTNNRTVKQQALAKNNKDIAYEQARQNLLPNLNASASQNWNFGQSVDKFINPKNSTSAGLNAQLTLFDGMKMKYSIDASKEDMMAANADLEKIKQDITMNVALGFMQILLNKELLQIAEDQLALTRTKIEQRKGLVAAGKLAEGELLDLLAQEAKEEMNRLQAENTLKLSLLDLAQYLEIDNFEKMDVVAPDNLSESDLQLLTADAVFQSALTHRPEIKGAEYRLKSSEYNVLIAKGNYYPSLSLGANYGTSYYNLSNLPTNNSFAQQLSDNMSAQIGLSLRVPIFNKFEVRNGVRSAELGVKSSKISIIIDNMQNNTIINKT